MNVVRYTPHAVLVANVEEARYRALASEDGRLLVEARYAVRNNQRSFLKVRLPAGATVWSAKISGHPIRPGLAEEGAVLLPLERGHAGEEAPTFVLEFVYLQEIESWPDKGRARIDLPALDLPISRTGLELHHSPRFRIELLPGTFRVENDPGPYAEAFRDAKLTPTFRTAVEEGRPVSAREALADRFRNESAGRTVAGALPVHVTFPTFGPSIFLASELTAEASEPSLELVFRKTRK